MRATSRTPSALVVPDGVETTPSAAPPGELLAGCAATLILVPALGDRPDQRLRELVGRAGELAVERLVLMSTASAADPLSHTGAHHLAMERELDAFSGSAYVLRPTPFAMNTIHWWSATISAGRFVEGPYLEDRRSDGP